MPKLAPEGGGKGARPVKEPILRNNFDSESTPGENGPQNAPPSPETTPVPAAYARSNPPPGEPHSALPLLVGEGQGEVAQEPALPLLVGEGQGEVIKTRRGPRTPAGKKRISRNAIKHAIFSPNPVVIAGLETIEEWEDFQAQVAESWAPVGKYERELAYDIAFGLRRLQRCRIHEAALLSGQVEETERELIAEANDDEDDDDDFDENGDGEAGQDESERPSRPFQPVDPATLRAHQLLSVIPDGFSIDRLLRYETHVRRALLQAVHELEARQARRLGEQPSLARVDFTAGPSLRPPSARGSSAVEQLNQSIARAQHDIAARRRSLPSSAAKGRSVATPSGHE